VKIEAQLPSSLSDGDSTGQKRPGETISESEGEEEEDAAGMLDAVVEAQESMDAGLAALSRITIINAENNKTIAAIPRLTSRLKKALRSTKTQLDELIAGITIISDRGASILERLKTASDMPEND